LGTGVHLFVFPVEHLITEGLSRGRVIASGAVLWGQDPIQYTLNSSTESLNDTIIAQFGMAAPAKVGKQMQQMIK
jgi:hypothetical protein